MYSFSRQFMRRIGIATAGIVLALSGLVWAAESQETFKVRLSWVPITVAMRATVTGSGSATATLSGSKLSVNGSFEGLRTPATTATLKRGSAAGVRGKDVFDLTVSKATTGTISGSFPLDSDQIEGLKKGQFYVQINSEKAPDGNLWGWLLR